MKKKLIAVSIAALLSTGVVASNGNANDVPPGKPFITLDDKILELKVYVDEEIVRIDTRLGDLNEKIDQVEADSIERDQMMAEYVELLVARMSVAEMRLDNAEENIETIYHTLNFVNNELTRIEANSLSADVALLEHIARVEANLDILSARIDEELISVLDRLDSAEQFTGELQEYAFELYDSLDATAETLRRVTKSVGTLDEILATECPSEMSVIEITENGTVFCKGPVDRYWTRSASSFEYYQCNFLCVDKEWWQVINLSCPAGYKIDTFSLTGTYTATANQYTYNEGRSQYWKSTRYEASVTGDLIDDPKTRTRMSARCKGTFDTVKEAEVELDDPVYVVTYPDGSTVTIGGTGYRTDGNWKKVPVEDCYYVGTPYERCITRYRWEFVGP